MHLSDTQRALFDFLREHIAAHGYSPSQMEIAAAFGFRQNRSARYHLQALADAGLIELTQGRARGIRLSDRSRPSSAAVSDGALSVPLFGRVAAGAPIGSDPEVRRHVTLDGALFRLRPDYLLEVEGDSMLLDGILPGDLIGVHRTPEARPGQIVVARIEGELTVKRLDISTLDNTLNISTDADSPRGHLRLLPRNPAYAPIEIDASVTDFAIEGLFAGLLRPG